MVDVDARRVAGQVVGLAKRVLAHHHRGAAGLDHATDDGEPVVGLVVQDPVGDALRFLLPRPHELRTVLDGIGQRLADSRVAELEEPSAGVFALVEDLSVTTRKLSEDPIADPVVCSLQRVAALGLYSVWPRDRTNRF